MFPNIEEMLKTPTTMNNIQQYINHIVVSSLPDLLRYCTTGKENLNKPMQVYLLQNGFTTDRILGKSGSYMVSQLW